MKWSFFFLTLSFIHTTVEARIIYGKDNRVEVYEATDIQRKVAKAVAVLIPTSKIQTKFGGKVNLTQAPLSSLRKLCPEVKFQKQPVAGVCSGFLIAPDIIATAGHCASYENLCEDFRWVFDYEVDKKTKKAGIGLSSENVYKCKKILRVTVARDLDLDYGLIQLDRKVLGREPLELRHDKKVEDKTPLFTVGSPLGLPLKVADDAKVRTNGLANTFEANLDTFSGSSGSPVLNSQTGLVEGILTSGELDFEPNYARGCSELKQCKDDGCRGETVLRSTAISDVVLLNPFMRAASSGNAEELEKFFELEVQVDFNLKDGETALMKAVQSGHAEIVKTLLERGADPSLANGLGNTSLHILAANYKSSSSQILEELLSYKAKLESKNLAGETPVLMAAKNLNLEAVKLFLKSGARNESVLAPFVKAGRKDAVEELVKMGVSQ